MLLNLNEALVLNHYGKSVIEMQSRHCKLQKVASLLHSTEYSLDILGAKIQKIFGSLTV